MQLHGPAKSLQLAQMSHENRVARQVGFGEGEFLGCFGRFGAGGSGFQSLYFPCFFLLSFFFFFLWWGCYEPIRNVVVMN